MENIFRHGVCLRWKTRGVESRWKDGDDSERAKFVREICDIWLHTNNAFERSFPWRRECEMKYLIKLKAKNFLSWTSSPHFPHTTAISSRFLMFGKSNNVVLRRNFKRNIPFTTMKLVLLEGESGTWKVGKWEAMSDVGWKNLKWKSDFLRFPLSNERFHLILYYSVNYWSVISNCGASQQQSRQKLRWNPRKRSRRSAERFLTFQNVINKFFDEGKD